MQFWPILGRVYTTKNFYEPFEVAVYCGREKPKSLECYLNDFIEELNKLLKNGINIKSKDFKIRVMCFICDRPARAFIKCIKGHTGFFACERCNVHGIRINNKTVFPVDQCEIRSDFSFRTRQNIEHHNDVSPLLSVQPSIDMIYHFPLDFMHMGCLGIMKRLLSEYWTKTNTKILTRQKILRISQRMMHLSNQVPSEFQRVQEHLVN